MVSSVDIENKLRAALDVTHLEVEDLTGTLDHYRVAIVSPAFDGKTRIEQHQSVYQALGDWMKQEIHALSLQTYTPENWQKLQKP